MPFRKISLLSFKSKLKNLFLSQSGNVLSRIHSSNYLTNSYQTNLCSQAREYCSVHNYAEAEKAPIQSETARRVIKRDETAMQQDRDEATETVVCLTKERMPDCIANRRLSLLNHPGQPLLTL